MYRLPADPQRLDAAVGVLLERELAAVAVAHLLIVLCTLPIVCRGSLWRPTRQIAAWRLRHLWGVYRTMMAVMGLWALVVIIIRAIAPETPSAKKLQ